MKKSPIISPSFLKQKARQLKRAKSISLNQAYDDVVKQYGFANYKNYLNVLKEGRLQTQLASVEAFGAEKDRVLSEKIAITNLGIQNINMSFQEFFESLKQVQNSGSEVQSLCEKKQGLKKYLELSLLKDFIKDEGGEIADYASYHVAKSVSLKNLTFEMLEDKLYVEGDYDLDIEFMFEVDRNDPVVKNDSAKRFDDERMFGSFELTIDRNMNIAIENQDIGHNW